MALAQRYVAIRAGLGIEGAESFGGLIATVYRVCFFHTHHASASAAEHSFFLICHKYSPQYELTAPYPGQARWRFARHMAILRTKVSGLCG
jgi:hypothetical protein